jgi:hypothetical protein
MAERRIRGSGLRYTLPFFFHFAALWLVVTIAAVLVAGVSSYLLFASRPDPQGADLRNAIILQTALSLLAVVALAVFTTHRLAGPWVAVRRALLAVRDGDFNTGLRFRVGDPRLQEVQAAFDEMIASLRERLGAPAGVVAEPMSAGGARAAAPPQP